MMILYFSIIGVFFYKLFIKSPYENNKAVQPDKSVITKNKAADSHA